MKKLVFLIIGAALALSGCKAQEKKELKGECLTYEGYLSLDGNKLLVDDFAFVRRGDKEMIANLGLTEGDMPNGYYIYNPTSDILEFNLTHETRYFFYDTGLLFLTEDSKTRFYATSSKEEFGQKFGQEGDLGKTPFEIQVLKDGTVLSVSEIFIN